MDLDDERCFTCVEMAKIKKKCVIDFNVRTTNCNIPRYKKPTHRTQSSQKHTQPTSEGLEFQAYQLIDHRRQQARPLQDYR